MPFSLESSFLLLLWPLSEPLQSLQSRGSSLTSCTKPLQQQALLLQLTSPSFSPELRLLASIGPLSLEPSENSLLLTRLYSATFSRKPLFFCHPTSFGNLLGSATLFLHSESLAGFFYHCSQSCDFLLLRCLQLYAL